MRAIVHQRLSASSSLREQSTPQRQACRPRLTISLRPSPPNSNSRSTQRLMDTTRQRSKAAVRGSGTSDANTVAPSTSTGHAWLHDFCVTIPYGAAMGALTLIAWLQQQSSFATILLGACIGSLSFTYLSLQQWKANKDCRPYTLLSAGAAALGALFSYQRAALVHPLLAWAATGVSAGVSLFLLYNVLAGGNPPQGEKPLADAAPHSVD